MPNSFPGCCLAGRRTATICRLAGVLLLLAYAAPTTWGDWHDLVGHGHHGGGPSDPHADAFITSAVLIVAASATILLFVGPALIVWARRIRSTFAVVPLANALIYLGHVAARPYPGGRGARFRSPGLWYTLGEILLLLLLTLLIVVVVAGTQWVVRKVRSADSKRAVAAVGAPGHAKHEG